MKVELDVQTLILGIEIIAEPGDRLMVYNGQVIGLLPKGASPAEVEAKLSLTPTSVYETVRLSWRDGITARLLGEKLHLDHSGRASLNLVLRRLLAEGTVCKHPEDEGMRYPRYCVHTSFVELKPELSDG